MKYCSNCGKGATDEQMFCQECGTQFEGVAKAKSMLQFPAFLKGLSPKAIKVGSVAIVLLLVVCIGVPKIIGVFNSPKKYIEKYYSAIIAGEYGKVYNLNTNAIESKELLTKDAFLEHAKAELEGDDSNYLMNFNILDEVKSYTSTTKAYNVEFIYEDGSKMQEIVEVAKTKKGRYYLTNSNMNLSNLMGNAKLAVQTGTKVVLNGVDLKTDYITSTNGTLDFYTIPAIFSGKNIAQLTCPDFEPIVGIYDTYKTTYHSSSSNSDYEDYIYSFDFPTGTKLTLTEEGLANINAAYTSAFQTVVSGLTNEKDPSTLNIGLPYYYSYYNTIADGLGKSNYYECSLYSAPTSIQIQVSHSYGEITVNAEAVIATDVNNRSYSLGSLYYLNTTLVRKDGKWQPESSEISTSQSIKTSSTSTTI